MRGTIKNLWPADRLERLAHVRRNARKLDLSVTVRNVGRAVPVFRIDVRNAETKTLVASFYDVEATETWVSSRRAPA